ncbi:MAG: thioesterase family protein [Candidatus Binatia bacterium]|nr:thioesterase family protein [Candidatus Binatia bacterium]
MATTVTTFLEMMRLESHGPDTYVGAGPSYPWGGLYGGQIVAQALRAAALTVEPRYLVHSLHAYFIRRGDATEPIRLEVQRIRDGRTFVTRHVVARQAAGAILNLAASFHIPEEGVDIQVEHMPEVPAPETLPNDTWSALIDRAFVDQRRLRGTVAAWMRLTEKLPDDAIVHACALAYLSDDLPTDAVISVHPEYRGRGPQYRTFWSASLDHAIWFHRPVQADQWHLHEFTCRGLMGTRGLSTGAIFDRDGRQVATVSQEVLVRLHRERGTER